MKTKFKVGDRVACHCRVFSFDPSEGIIKEKIQAGVHPPIYRVEIEKSTEPIGGENAKMRDFLWNYFEKELSLLKEIIEEEIIYE